MDLKTCNNKVYKQIVERRVPQEALTKVYTMPGYIEAYTNGYSEKLELPINFDK